MTQQCLPPTDSYPRETKTYVHTKVCTQTFLFLAALFITAKNWKQPKCLLMNDNEKYLIIKRNKLPVHAIT